MVDSDLLLAKASNVRKHLKRARQKCGQDLTGFLGDRDRQDIVSFNLQMAIQNCIDIAAHIISIQGETVPGSVNEMFYYLQENDLLSAGLVEKMVKAVGFRNLLVHEYGRIDFKEIYRMSRRFPRVLMKCVKKAGATGLSVI